MDGVLDTSAVAPCSRELRSYTQDISQEDHQLELHTKRAVIRVCTLWWQLAIEYLYEIAWISKSTVLQSLLKTLQDAGNVHRSYADRNRPLGHYIKRLCFAMEKWVHSPSIEEAFQSLFILCSDVRICSFRPVRWGRAWRTALLGRTQSLLCCKIQGEGYGERLSPFFRLLLFQFQEYGLLEVLHMSAYHPYIDFDQESFHFPRLHTLSIEYNWRGVANVLLRGIVKWNLPLLSSLTVAVRLHDYAQVLEMLLLAHGMRLTTLVLQHAGEMPDNHEALQTVPLLLSAKCPLLQDLSIDYRFFQSEGATLPTLPHLGRIYLQNFDSSVSTVCRQIVDRIIGMMARPCIIELPGSSRPLCWNRMTKLEFDSWREWAEKLFAEGVRVEGWDGSLNSGFDLIPGADSELHARGALLWAVSNNVYLWVGFVTDLSVVNSDSEFREHFSARSQVLNYSASCCKACHRCSSVVVQVRRR
jgi:hypothetical protein